MRIDPSFRIVIKSHKGPLCVHIGWVGRVVHAISRVEDALILKCIHPSCLDVLVIMLVKVNATR